MATIDAQKVNKQATQKTKDANTQAGYVTPAPTATANAGDIALPKYGTGQTANQSTPAVTTQSSGSNAMVQNTGNTASNNVMTEAAKAYAPDNGMMGIRDTLVSRGINTNRIGWNANTGMVTIDGKDAFKPSSIVDGVSYASEKDINNLTDTAFYNSGDPISGVTGYVSNAGLSNAVTWADGKLMIGGMQVPVAYVQGGKAYAKKSDIDKAIAVYKENAGITGNQEVVNNWESKYGDRIQDALDAVMNREKWSYNPEDDPAYQVYADAYTREGNRAYQNAYAQMAANTGGYGSSAGMTAAGQQMNYYMQQLGDRVPELMQDSYNRYLGEQELNRSALESLRSVAQDEYNREYQANRDSINDATTAGYYDYLRDRDARQDEVEDRKWAYDKMLYDQELESGNISNRTAKLQSVLTNYMYGGDINAPIPAEEARAAGIPMKSDGTYPSIKEMYTSYADLQALIEQILWEQYGKQETIDTWKINNGLY